MHLKRYGVQPFSITKKTDGTIVIRRPVKWFCHLGHLHQVSNPNALNGFKDRPFPYHVMDAVDAGIPLDEGRGRALAVLTPTVQSVAQRLGVTYYEAQKIHRGFLSHVVNLAKYL